MGSEKVSDTTPKMSDKISEQVYVKRNFWCQREKRRKRFIAKHNYFRFNESECEAYLQTQDKKF